VSKDARTRHQLREAIGEGYAVVAARAYTDTVSAVTLGDLAARQINSITKDDGPLRQSKLNEVTRIKNSVAAAVAAAKKMKPSTFATDVDDSMKTNTAQGNIDPVTGKAKT